MELGGSSPAAEVAGLDAEAREAEIRASDSWFRRLKDDRLEIYLLGAITDSERSIPLKVRASGPEWAMWRIVEMFEEMTGKEVVGEWKRPPRMGPRPLEGQLSITEQLESADAPD